MLGEIPTPNGTQLMVWLGCASFVMLFVNQARKFIDGFKDKPSPGDVKHEAAEKYALRSDIEKRFADVVSITRDLFSKVGGVERGAREALGNEIKALRAERHEDSKTLQSTLTEVQSDIGGLKTATQMQNQQLAQMQSTLNQLLQRSKGHS